MCLNSDYFFAKHWPHELMILLSLRFLIVTMRVMAMELHLAQLLENKRTCLRANQHVFLSLGSSTWLGTG